MDRVNCVDIDRRTLADSEYKVIINARKTPNAVIEGEGGASVDLIPYALAIKPQGKYPSLLRFFLENLYWLMVERDNSRTGLIVVEDEEGWFNQHGQLRKPIRPCYFELEFDWEPLEIYNGTVPSIAKANATVVRDARDSQGVVRFKVKRVRGVSTCGSDCAPSVRIEKVWQFVDKQRVTTFCATRDPLRFREDESVVEIRGVHAEVDGCHVVEEVYLEGDQYECNCFSFNGCQILGATLDEDTYLLWDRGGDASTDAWAAERCRVDQEGLYHVRILPPQNRCPGPTPRPSAAWQEGSHYGRDDELQGQHWGAHGDSMAQSYGHHENDPAPYMQEAPHHSSSMVQSQQLSSSYHDSYRDATNSDRYPVSTEPLPPPVRHPMAGSGGPSPTRSGYPVAEPSLPPMGHPMAAPREVQPPPIRHPMAGSGEPPAPSGDSMAGSRRPSPAPSGYHMAGSREPTPAPSGYVTGSRELSPPPVRHPIAGSGEPTPAPSGYMTGSRELSPPPVRHPIAGSREPMPAQNGYATARSRKSSPPPNVHPMVGSGEPSRTPVRHPMAGSGEHATPPVRHLTGGAGELPPPPIVHTMTGSGRLSPPLGGYSMEGPQGPAPSRPPSSGYPSTGYREPVPVVGSGALSARSSNQAFSGSREAPPIPPGTGASPPPPQSGVPFHQLSPPPPLPQSSSSHERQYYTSSAPDTRSQHGRVPAEGSQERRPLGGYADPRPSYSPPPPSCRPPSPAASTHASSPALSSAQGEAVGAPVQREIRQHVTEAARSPRLGTPQDYQSLPHPAPSPPPVIPRPAPPAMPPGLLPKQKQDAALQHPPAFERLDPGRSNQGYHVANGGAARPTQSIPEKVGAGPGQTVRHESHRGHEVAGGEKRPATPGDKGHIELKDLQQDLSKCFSPSIWNKSKRSASGSVRCQSPAPSLHRQSSTSRDALKRDNGLRQTSLTTRSSGKLDDTRLPKSPKLYKSSYSSQPNSPRSTSPQIFTKVVSNGYSDREGTGAEVARSSGMVEERDRRISPRSNQPRHEEIGSGKSEHHYPRPAEALVDGRDQWRLEGQGGKETRNVEKRERLALCGSQPSQSCSSERDGGRERSSRALPSPATVPGVVPGLKQSGGESAHQSVPANSGQSSHGLQEEREPGGMKSLPVPLPVPVPVAVVYEGNDMLSRKRSASPNRSDIVGFEPLRVHPKGTHHAEAHSHRSRSPSQKSDRRSIRDSPSPDMRCQTLEIPAIPTDKPSLKRTSPQEYGVGSGALRIPDIPRSSNPTVPGVASSERPSTPMLAVQPLAIVPVGRPVTPVPSLTRTPPMRATLPEPITPSPAPVSRPPTPMPAATQVPISVSEHRRPKSAGPLLPVPIPKPSLPTPSLRPPIPTAAVAQKQETVPGLPQPIVPTSPSISESVKRTIEKLQQQEPVQMTPRRAETLDLPVPVIKPEPKVLSKGAPLRIPSLSGVASLQRVPSKGSIEGIPQKVGTQMALATKDRNSDAKALPLNARGSGSVIVTDRPRPSNADRSKLPIGSLELVKQSINLETEVLESEQWRTAMANLSLMKPSMVPGSLQTVAPDNPALSGLAGPRCTVAQQENAAVKFRSVVDARIRAGIRGIPSGVNKDVWIRICQGLIETIGQQLPNVLMQRGDYLYVVSKKLTPIISDALQKLEIPPSSMGGVVMHLFDAVNSVYRDVRIRVSNGEAEETPAHIYQDLEMDAIQKMNQPNLAEAQIKSDETGKIQMKVFPGTCMIPGTPSVSVDSLKLKGSGPVPVPIPTPVIPSGLGPSSVVSDSDSSTSLARSMSNRAATPLPRSTPQKLLDCALPVPAEAPKPEDMSSMSATQSMSPPLSGGQWTIGGGVGGGALSSSFGGKRDVFEDFEISSMQNKSNKDVVDIVMHRLALNKALFAEFLEGWLEDSGKDVFLERFVRLQNSTRATLADPGANSALVLGGLGREPPGIPLGGLNPPPIMPITQLSQESMNIPTLLSDISPIPGLMDEKVVLPSPVPVNPSPLGDFIKNILNTPGSLTDENIANVMMKHSGQMSKMFQTNLSQPKFMNKIKDYIQGERPSQPLRKYQECCVEKAESGRNYIFVAPTGSGKTKIFVECTRRLLKRKPDAKIVVICPTVPLASQQAAVFVFEGFMEEGYQINAFSGENPLAPPMWPHVRGMTHVMVMTPQILLSILEEGHGGFHEIDLLVLDECHHCRGDHPYSKIMDHYRSGLIAGQKRGQVLGFTASPAKSSTLEQACAEMQQLLEKTDAECVVINEDNKEVQQHVPSAEEETLYIEPREEDQHFSMCMGKYLFNACAQVLLELIEENPCLQPITQQAMVDLNCGVHSPTFENWCKKSVELLVVYPTISDRRKQILRASIELLRGCNIALDLVKEGGFEVALRHISKSTALINLGMVEVERAGDTIYDKLCLGLYNIQPIRDVTMLARAFHMTDNPGDFRSFPRFIAIVRFLEGYKHQDSFHGIIFCRTRDAVYSLTDMLRQSPALYFVQAMPFIGHGRTTRRSSKGVKLDGNNAALAVRGMTGTQQRDVLTKFQSRGRHVLVSTRAAEEGINVTTCAFVVRYSVTETGIERIQSRGRTRVHGGKFVNIVEKESKEGKMFLKSVKEEATMNQVLKLFANAHHVV